MKTSFLLFIFLFAFSLSNYGQNVTNPSTPVPEKKKHCLTMSSLNISNQTNNYKTDEDHRDQGNLEQNGPPQNKPNDGFQGMKKDHGFSNSNSRKFLSLEIGFNPYSKKLGDYNRKREFLIGLFYSGSDLVNRNSTEFTSRPGDTLSFNSVMYQTDTLSKTHHTFRKEADVLGLSFQYLYKTDPEKMISLFTGYGMNVGYTINSRIYERNSKDSVVALNFYNALTNYSNFENSPRLGSEETIVSKNADPTLITSVYIPFGLNMRLCKTKEIWNQLNLFVKGVVGLEADINFGHNTHFLPYMGCSMGFKFALK